MQNSHNAKITFKLITGKHFAVTNKWDTTTKRLNWSQPTGWAVSLEQIWSNLQDLLEKADFQQIAPGRLEDVGLSGYF